MVALNFDATNVPIQTPFTLLPPGRYVCKIIASEMKPTREGGGQFLELTHQVIDGENAGVTFKNNLNLENNNQTTVEIAYRTLSTLCHIVGKVKIKDSSELHNVSVVATVAVRTYTKNDGTQGSSNEVKGYEKATDSSVSTSSAVASAQTHVEQPATAPMGNRPAWAQKSA